MTLHPGNGVAAKVRLTRYLQVRGYEFERISRLTRKGRFTFQLSEVEVPARAKKRLGTYKITDASGQPLKPEDLRRKFNTLFHND